MSTLDFDPEPVIARSVSEWARREALASPRINERAVAAALVAYESGASVPEAIEVGRRFVESWLRHPSQSHNGHHVDQARPRAS